MERLVTAGELTDLLTNARRGLDDPDYDPTPIVALRASDGPQVWLLTELGADGDTAYGLCDLGIGAPELGEVSLAWLADFRGPLGMAIERMPANLTHSQLTISALARIASAAGRTMP